jgi:hypothetical protein
MRGDDQQQTAMFSYLTLAQRIPADHPARQLMEQMNYNLLFRWFVGLEMDDAVWDVTVFTKNRERLIQGEISQKLLGSVLVEAREHNLLSEEHFTVDGTLIQAGIPTDRSSSVGWEAWAAARSFKEKSDPPAAGKGSPPSNEDLLLGTPVRGTRARCFCATRWNRRRTRMRGSIRRPRRTRLC